MRVVLEQAPPECADAGTVCGLVWRLTHQSWLAESSHWLVVRPVRILLIIFVALLVRWLLHRAINRITRSTAEGRVPVVLRPLKERVPAALREAAGLVSERRRQRAETLGSLLRSVVSVAVFAVAAMLILDEFEFSLAPVLTSAGILGVALGFGAQSLVKDFLAGIFMLFEDQYGVGDVVDVGEARGTVEAVGLRVTTLRDAQGVLWYVRNGEIIRVGNRSQGWSMVVVDVPVGFDTKVEDAAAAMERAARSLAEDDAWAADLIEPPGVLGVEQLTAEGAVIRVTAKTLSEAQWRVARELRRRVTDALQEAGIAAQLPTGRVYLRPPAGGGTDLAGPT